jgi:hypothetical protein
LPIASQDSCDYCRAGMDYPAGPSPAWLGALALAGFSALVAASFASGYHLVGGGSEKAPVAASVGSRTGIVREGLSPDRAVLRERADEAANIVARLPSGVAVTVISENGEYAQIRYERQGKVFEGWTRRANLSLR